MLFVVQLSARRALCWVRAAVPGPYDSICEVLWPMLCCLLSFGEEKIVWQRRRGMFGLLGY
jgi:hypothetical protein